MSDRQVVGPVRTPVRTFVSGRVFLVRVLPRGARYGRGLEVADDPLVEVYDAEQADDRYPGEIGGFGPLGQFVDRYQLSTLLASRGAIDLNGGVAVWKLGARTADEMREWLAMWSQRLRTGVSVD